MKRLNIGSGKVRYDGYVNIDIEPSHEPDICGDVLTMEFEDVDVIYGCHFFEHLAFPYDAVKCLELFYKWLKPGGILRLAVPDLGKAAAQYVGGGSLKELYGEDFKGYYYKDTPCERFNFFVKAWGHQICYDFGLLSSLLADAGFKNIERKNAQKSIIPEFSHDRFESESLYIEAIK